MYDQQHPFFFAVSFFLVFSFVDGTSTGMNLHVRLYTFIIAYFQLRQELSSQKLDSLLHYFLHSLKDVLFLDAFGGINLLFPLILHAMTIGQFCSQQV